MNCFTLLSFKVILWTGILEVCGSADARGIVLKSCCFGVGVGLCPQRSVCKDGLSPDRPHLIKPLKPCLVWLSLLTVRGFAVGTWQKRGTTWPCTLIKKCYFSLSLVAYLHTGAFRLSLGLNLWCILKLSARTEQRFIFRCIYECWLLHTLFTLTPEHFHRLNQALGAGMIREMGWLIRWQQFESHLRTDFTQRWLIVEAHLWWTPVYLSVYSFRELNRLFFAFCKESSFLFVTMGCRRKLV